eukprot:1823190-Amphidinium_carterae.1
MQRTSVHSPQNPSQQFFAGCGATAHVHQSFTCRNEVGEHQTHTTAKQTSEYCRICVAVRAPRCFSLCLSTHSCAAPSGFVEYVIKKMFQAFSCHLRANARHKRTSSEGVHEKRCRVTSRK